LIREKIDPTCKTPYT